MRASLYHDTSYKGSIVTVEYLILKVALSYFCWLGGLYFLGGVDLTPARHYLELSGCLFIHRVSFVEHDLGTLDLLGLLRLDAHFVGKILFLGAYVTVFHLAVMVIGNVFNDEFVTLIQVAVYQVLRAPLLFLRHYLGVFVKLQETFSLLAGSGLIL